MRKIIVDVMGGDRGVAEAVGGVALAAKELEAELILVGDRGEIEAAAGSCGLSLEGMNVIHTPVAINMEDSPMSVIHAKSDSSMSIGLRLLAEGGGDAFVSTGNTGALFTGANLIVRKVSGVRRPAIAALLPMQPPVLLLDSGANISVTPENLEHFALMGSAYMKKVHGLTSPRVGLLNNGAEPTKGTELQQNAYRLLASEPTLNFVGNVEGNRVMQDVCDVLVTDGFSGNILLKTMEGMGRLMLTSLKEVFYSNFRTKLAAGMIQGQLAGMKKNFDAGEYGGAPILGIAKPVIKAHGASDAKALKNAVRQAIAYCDADLTGEIAEALRQNTARRRAEVATTEKEKD